MALANKYERLVRSLIGRAIELGISPARIENSVEDPYYMDLDEKAANAAIADLIDESLAAFCQ